MDKAVSNIDAIKEAARIYKNAKLRPLTSYQLKINEAAQEICLSNPSMLRNRQSLLEEARTRVNETYDFKKGKSRSKRYAPAVQSTSKRPKLDQTARLARMSVLEQDIKNIEDRISYKQKRRQVAEDTRNYRACDELTEEIGELMKNKRELTQELSILSKKDKQSQRYFKRKSSSSASPQSSRTTSPVPASDSDASNSRSDSHDTLPVSSDNENSESHF